MENYACMLYLAANIRLVGGSTDYEGRVEVYYDGAWGTVCDDTFNHDAGSVACAELGYGPGGSPICRLYIYIYTTFSYNARHFVMWPEISHYQTNWDISYNLHSLLI